MDRRDLYEVRSLLNLAVFAQRLTAIRDMINIPGHILRSHLTDNLLFVVESGS